ncbi:MAG: HAMP domain-containing histidine kinase [Alphaproteobacteria bacterium]|nr:HAMP domain-containing histidine kinase [Alphaproteobacteria bacterium]MBT4085449.1 HAMP domain-containing histidine kinase [Alphaproteobacteria bacterium]MBT4546149.1 HAMP domain-containing histidine kinase [Alphaproteobacteria bacterium]
MTFNDQTIDKSIHKWTGEFSDTLLETTFQNYMHRTRLVHLQYMASIAAAVFFLLIIPEYFRLGQEPVFTWLAAARTILALIILCCVFGIRYFPKYADEFAFSAQFIIPIGLTLFDFLKGGEVVFFGNMVLTVLVLYLFVPNRMVYSASACTLATIMTAVSLALTHHNPAPVLVQMYIMLIVANIFGYAATLRFNVIRRREYASYMTEREGREQLRAEVERRMATEDGLRLALSDADRTSRQKSGALDDLSHELRTPLNAIIGYSETIKKEVFGPLNNDQYKEYVSVIHESGNHLLELITKMLDHSKAESGTVTLTETTVDIEELVNGVLPMVGSLAREAGIEIKATSRSAVPLIRADEQKIRQILLNLLSNALKFTPAGGVVELIVDVPENQTVMLAVRDTGVGIPKEDIEKVFQPFEQSMAHGLRGESGTGLGLSLSARLAELHGGYITVESTVNEGSLFTLILPKERNLGARPDETEDIAQ